MKCKWRWLCRFVPGLPEPERHPVPEPQPKMDPQLSETAARVVALEKRVSVLRERHK